MTMLYQKENFSSRLPRNEWQAVNKSSPCPICGKADNCKVAGDAVTNQAVWCGRTPSDRQNQGGQWLHFIGDRIDSSQFKQQSRQSQKPKVSANKKSHQKNSLPPPERFQAEGAKDACKTNLEYWSQRYCVNAESWLAIRAVAYQTIIQIPEVDPKNTSTTVGIISRGRSSNKADRWRCGKGHCRGVTIAGKPSGEGDAVIVVEGASDCAAVVSAGAEPIGKSTRDADLRQIAPLLDDVPDYHPIIVLIENDDPPKNWKRPDREWPWNLVNRIRARAQELANELGRPIVIACPPDGINDFADWWRVATDNQGHLLKKSDRQEIGTRIVNELIGTGLEIAPSSESAKRRISSELAEFSERQLCRAEVARQDAIERGHGNDADYDHVESCTFHKSFKKVDSENHKTKYLFGHLSCKSWKCVACRTRKKIPEWTIHLAALFAKEDVVYRKSIIESDPKKLKLRVEKTKKAIRRSNGQYASIAHGDDEMVIYATTAPSGKCSIYELTRYVTHFSALLEMLQLDVIQIEGDIGGKPICTSRQWSKDKEEPKGWIPLDVSPKLQDVREAAKAVNALPMDVDFGPTSAFCDALFLSLPGVDTQQIAYFERHLSEISYIENISLANLGQISVCDSESRCSSCESNRPPNQKGHSIAAATGSDKFFSSTKEVENCKLITFFP